MDRFGQLVVKYRKAVIAAYLLLLFSCATGYLATRINYDLLSYMPDHLNAKQGERLLEEEFALSGMGMLLVEGKGLWEIELLIDSLEAVDGIDRVVWVGDFIDIYRPRAFLEPSVSGQFIAGETVLLQILFEENVRAEKTNEAVGRIKEIIAADEGIMLGGEPAIVSEMRRTTEREILYYTAVAVAMILVVLTLSSSSYLDPLLFLISVGVAVIINMGTNFLQGEISFLTASIAAVMQLGISLDYAIFLLHRFEEEISHHLCAEKAMSAAVGKTALAIASSALTTIGGFAALTVMQNGIGRDMGLVLAKGIVISLAVTLTFLPGLILACYRFSRRCRHRVMLPSFKSVASLAVKTRRVFPVLFLLLLIPSFQAQNKVEYYFSIENYLPDNSPAVLATTKIMERFGAADVLYVILPDEGRVKEKQAVEAIKAIPAVRKVSAISEQIDLALPDSIIPGEILESFRGNGYRYFLVYLDTFGDEQAAFAAVEQIRDIASSFHEEYYVTGSPALTRDMASLVEGDARNVALFSIVCICLIIALGFRSLSLPVILIAAIQLAIWINLSILYYQDQVVSSLTPMIIGAIQLGATVDYAILFTSRYRENTYLFLDRVAAAKQTVIDTGRPILTSALTLCAATAGISLVAEVRATGEITMLIGRGAVISMLVIFFILPSLLLLCDKLIGRTTAQWAPLLWHSSTEAKQTKPPGGEASD